MFVNQQLLEKELKLNLITLEHKTEHHIFVLEKGLNISIDLDWIIL